MVRSRRSISKEDTLSVLTDSGISLSSPPAASHHQLDELDEEEVAALFEEPCDSDDSDDSVTLARTKARSQRQQRCAAKQAQKTKAAKKKDFAEPSPPSKKPRKTHICAVCQKEFGGNTDLKRHELIHSNERPYKCQKCDKCYRQAVNLKNHITTAHENKRQFRCSQCPKSFALKERLRLHMRLHSGEKPYACTLCDNRYARGGQLHQHMVTFHKTSTKQFKCKECTSTFTSTANLRAHMERHENGSDHKCEICNVMFHSDKILRSHINKIHYKVTRFECEYCDKTIEDTDLNTHMKTHANIRYTCDVCDSFFAQKSAFNVHMRMHTGERPYQCRICWQTFAHSSVLKLHIRKHTGEKPFTCLLCKDDLAFSQLAHLKTHMKKIHKQENPYMCEGCNQFFKVKVELLHHMTECSKVKDGSAQPDSSKDSDAQKLSQLRFLIALLLKKISPEQKLVQLGYEKRLIDNVVIAALKLANRKACDDQKLTALERMRINIEEFLNWIVPAKVMQTFQQEKLSVECILDKIVTMHTKQKNRRPENGNE